MILWNTLVLGFKEIAAHKFRSLLTMLGIILGVSSLVAMSALVKGMEIGAREALIAIGGLQKVRIEPQRLPPDQYHLKDQSTGITLRDVQALQSGAPMVSSVSPEMRQYNAVVSANAQRTRGFLAGVWPVAVEMNEHKLAHGRMFNAIDDENARSVCVIGAEIRDELFGNPDDTGEEIIPVGQTIQINGQPFTVIGMFERYESEQDRKTRVLEASQPKLQRVGPSRDAGGRRSGRQGGFVYRFKNNAVYVPLTTYWIKLRTATGGFGSPAYSDPRLSNLEVRIRDVDQMEAALQQVRNVMMTTHKGIEDFTFRTQEDWSEGIETFIRNARWSGGIIAGISLVVGGIGIMNIMLASISGRIREIGIRKAIGASTADVFIQILVESVVIAILGGILGLAAAYGLVQLIGEFAPTDNEPVITAMAMTLGFAASVAIGILAGIVPAFKAAGLHPIEALRYE